MASSNTMKEVLAVFVLLVLALALTPSVGSFVTDANYTEYTQVVAIAPLVANSTVLTYNARNDSSTYAYFTITLDPANMYGQTNVDVTKNITYTVSSKTLAFKVGVLDDGETYDATITYYTDDLTSSIVIALLPIVPILWIVAVLSVGIVMVTVLLKRH